MRKWVESQIIRTRVIYEKQPMHNKTKTIAVRIPVELHEHLREVSRRARTTMNNFCVDAISAACRKTKAVDSVGGVPVVGTVGDGGVVNLQRAVAAFDKPVEAQA